jgi:hypothetical protein
MSVLGKSKKTKSKRHFCNFKNVVCLNDDKSAGRFIRDIKTVMRKNNKGKLVVKPYSYYYKKRSEEHNFILRFNQINQTELQIEIRGPPKTDENKNDRSIVCLKFFFYNPNKYFNKWGKSKIELIGKGNCQEKDKEAILSGSFILNLANKLNDILEIKYSFLSDDSKKKTECGDISIKMTHLIKYGQTWYEREGGFSLDEKKYYKLAKQVEELSIANIYKNIKDQSIINIMDEILLKLDIKGRNIKIKNLLIKGIGRDSPLTLCDQKKLYENTLQLPEKFLAGFDNLREFGKLHTQWSASTRSVD